MSAIGLRFPVAVPRPRRVNRAERTPLTDDALLEQVGVGDPDAFACLYDRHASIAFGLALRVVRDRALAEDVVQDAFLDAWRTANRFRPTRGGARSWLLMLVHRRAVDMVRRRVRMVPSPDLLVDAAESASDVAWLNLERVQVQSALASLAPEQRQVLELAYYGGLTQSEVAEATGEPLGTVKSRTASGLRRLRDALVAGEVEVDAWNRSPSTT
jgi:RNA polymerase sigma factor (sigma-70 family)